jgi:hypothetical protein
MRAALLALCAMLFLNCAAAEGDEISKEYQIKAAFLYNFSKYVEWPARTFADAGSPIVIGVYCPGGFGDVLKQIVTGRQVGGRAIAVRTLATAAEAASAQLIYVCPEYSALWEAVATSTRERPVLVVADSEHAAIAHGTIAFVLDGDKVRFNIDMDSAGRAGLKVSDQLQKLAITVKRTP